MITVYLHCEGVTDYAVIPIFMKKANEMHDVNIQWIQRATLNKIRTHRKSGINITSHYRLINALATFSYLNGIKHIAYHQDADGNFSEVHEAILSQFQPLKKIGFHCLAIVPKEMIESWLLADENAYPSIPDEPKLPAKPEEIWGQKSDHQSNYPKNYFSRVLSQFGLPNNRDTYAHIAEKTDVKALKRRCPESFGQFYTDIQSFMTEESPT